MDFEYNFERNFEKMNHFYPDLSRWLEQFNALNKSYSYSINNIGLVKYFYSNIPFTGFLFIEKVIFLIFIPNKTIQR